MQVGLLHGFKAKGSLGPIWDHLKLLYIERLTFFSFLSLPFPSLPFPSLPFSFLFFSFLFFSFLFFSFLYSVHSTLRFIGKPLLTL